MFLFRSFIYGYLEAIDKIDVNSKLKLQKVIVSILDRLEKQYPVEFEKAIHLSTVDHAGSEERKKEIRKLLGVNWDVDHTSLFLKLNHSSAAIRLDAIRSVVQTVLKGKV